MSSQRGAQLSGVVQASVETVAGRRFDEAKLYPMEVQLSKLPRLRAVIKEIVASNRGRLSLLVCWDLIAIAVAVNAGYLGSPSYTFHVDGYFGWRNVMLPLGLTFIVSAMSFGLYEKFNGEGSIGQFIRCVVATGCAWAVALLTQYAVKYAATGRWVVLISEVVLVGLVFSGRSLLRYVQQRLPVNVVVFGDEQVGRSIQSNTRRRPYPPIRVLAVLPMTCDAPPEFPAGACASSDSGPGSLISWIVVHGRCEGSALEGMLPFLQNGTRVGEVSTFFESIFQKVPVEFIDTNWLIQANVSLVTMATRFIKRATDILTALVGLMLTLPLWPVIAIGIKLSSNGPVFYRQERVGRHGKIFTILKFRTMTVDAESSGKAVWATREDKRVTVFGRFLRKTRFDELPQFISVLVGDMSLVGPRPERPQFVRTLTEKVPHYQLRHLVRPGITGWAQISYRYAASFDDSVEKLRYDLYYVKHGGVLLDLQIMLRTVGVLMRGSR